MHVQSGDSDRIAWCCIAAHRKVRRWEGGREDEVVTVRRQDGRGGEREDERHRGRKKWEGVHL